MRSRYLSVLVPAIAAGVMACSALAQAQSGLSDSGPVFSSDLQRQQEQEEAERAARRKTYEPVVYPKYMEGGDKPDIQPVVPPVVYFDRDEEVGSIIVDTQERKLYFILPNRQAYEYPISVGREGFTWTGNERISRIASWPSWTPPSEMHQRVPGLPLTVSGGLKNPQGARALYLGNTVYRIHGTNNDRTVGRSNSSGCFRLTNEHVIHLASIAKVGTKVAVMQRYSGGVSPNAPLSSLFDFGFSNPETAPKSKPKSKAASQSKKSAAKPAAGSAVPAAVKQSGAATSESSAVPAASAATPASDAQAAAQAARSAAAEAAAAAQAARSAASAAAAIKSNAVPPAPANEVAAE